MASVKTKTGNAFYDRCVELTHKKRLNEAEKIELFKLRQKALAGKKPCPKERIADYFSDVKGTYGEQVKILLLFRLLNFDNDFGNEILRRIEDTVANGKPEEGFDDLYFKGMIDVLDLVDQIEEEKRGPKHEQLAALVS